MYFNWGALKTTYTTAFTLAFKQVINPMPVSEKLPIANIQNTVSAMLNMATLVVGFSNGVYEIRNIFA